MGHLFPNGSNVHCTATSTPVTGTPLTLACWFKAVGTAAALRTLVMTGGTSPNADGHILRLNSASVEACTESGAVPTKATAVATGSFTADVWTHACGVFASATSRTAYRDGANAGTDATNLTPTATFSRIAVGVNDIHGGTSEPYGSGNGGGDIAHIGLWSVALTADDVAELAAGVSPLLVRPEALVCYVPMFQSFPAVGTNNETDLMQGRLFPTTGGAILATSTTEPAMFFPGRQPIAAPTAAAIESGHTIHVIVNGTDVTNKAHIESLSISESATQQPNTARVAVHNMTPLAGHTIKIYEGASLRFGGTVRNVTKLPRDAVTVMPIYELDCIDYSYRLKARLIQKVYVNQAADVVVKDIIDTYASGVTRANVDNLLPTISIAFDFAPVAVALDQIAAMVAARWRVDYSSDLNFRISSFQSAPSSLTSSPVYPFRQFGHEEDIGGVVTRLYLLGASSNTTAAVSAGASTIPVNDTTIFQGSGTRKSVSGENSISYTGTSTASGPGNLTGVSGVAYAMAQGDEVALSAQADDTTAQALLAARDGTDGIREVRLRESTITSYADLVIRAAAKLSTVSAVHETVRYTTEDPMTTPGADVVVNVDGINTVLQIQEQRLYAISNPNSPLQREVSASTDWMDFIAMIQAMALKTAKIG